MVFNKKTNWNKILFSFFCNYKTIFIIQRKYLQGEFGYLYTVRPIKLWNRKTTIRLKFKLFFFW